MSKIKALGYVTIGVGLGLLLWQTGEFLIWLGVQQMASQGA